MFSIIKRCLPHSLFGRFLLITLVPIVLVQLIATYAFYERHWSSVSRHMVAALVGDVAMLVESVNGTTKAERDRLINVAASTLYLHAYFIENATLQTVQEIEGVPFSELDDELNSVLDFDHLTFYSERHNVMILVELKEGVLKVVSPIKRISNPTTYIFILWMSGSATILALVSVFFMRNQIRSIAKLAEAADQFGKGQELSEFKPTGALEVRQASRAFLEMKERIQRQVSQRIEMLAGISHDLKTPITRIKLHLAMMKQTKDIKELQDDLQQMEHMVQAYLDFARGNENTSTQQVNFAELLRSIAAGYRNQHFHIDVRVQAGLTLSLNEQGIRRAFTNIIDNALRYGSMVKIECAQLGDSVRVIFDDNGPGIPASKHDIVFKPFLRLETSRNSDTGGAGLGLSITKDIIVRHGGAITLDESPLGGLRVLITLPT
jgi:two-component system osmolarity sensor histidine kinase EnvZ